ncbi:hypothetical protein K469DRAFT_769972 [Zopfia rhizophila CBS 207.26]|uniref:Heterokaryon incompatibility domain-containing protein n=1 Tax=Zopfia rhizophila CBS 207.26 TaxID=1314779 RepID=A0A6A6EB10_9PEZI|nr:hypothetical protein K469DRAFT_769972 [Zopfia rhizophila CBS 207.26]
MIGSGLEQDHDHVLSLLFKAAVEGKENSREEEFETVGEFLRRCVDVRMGVGADEEKAFLQLALENLLQSNSTGERPGNTPSSEYIRPSSLSSSGMVLSIGTRTMGVVFQRHNDVFLDRLAQHTVPLVPSTFAHKPPIRTIAVAEDTTSFTHDIHWMQRIWVTLEYSLSKSACIMGQSNRIWRTVEGDDNFSRDTFSGLVSRGQGFC